MTRPIKCAVSPGMLPLDERYAREHRLPPPSLRGAGFVNDGGDE